MFDDFYIDSYLYNKYLKSDEKNFVINPSGSMIGLILSQESKLSIVFNIQVDLPGFDRNIYFVLIEIIKLYFLNI